MVGEPEEEGGWEDVGVGVTREEEEMEKRVEWSGTRWVGMVESEEKAGPSERTEKRKIRCLSRWRY